MVITSLCDETGTSRIGRPGSRLRRGRDIRVFQKQHRKWHLLWAVFESQCPTPLRDKLRRGRRDGVKVFSNRRMSLGKSLDGGGGSSFPV